MSILYRSVAHSILLAYAISAALGCSAGATSQGGDGNFAEEVESVDQAFSEPSCLEAPFDFTNVSPGGARDFVYSSPETYDHGMCKKAVVLRLKDVYTLGAPGGKALTSLRAQYGAPGPFTKEECLSSLNGIKVWTDSGTSASGNPVWTDLGRSWANGVWRDGKCFHPVSVISIPTHANTATWNYRVNATARLANDQPTRVIVQNGPCGHLGEKACGGFDCLEGTRTNGLDCKPIETIQKTCIDATDGYVKGSATVTLSNTGQWGFAGHVHNNAVYGSNYTLGMVSPVFNATQIGLENHGTVHGIDFGDRNDDFNKSGIDMRIADNWGALKFGGDWGCKMRATANPWLVGEDALIGLGLVAATYLAVAFIADPDTTCEWGYNPGETHNEESNIAHCYQ